MMMMMIIIIIIIIKMYWLQWSTSEMTYSGRSYSLMHRLQ